MNKEIKEFPITFYGKSEHYSDVLTKARCRIFYKYANRNGTYFNDEVAEKLVSTLPYTLVKGIYDEDSEDFTDHGDERTDGRVYGIVPETNNFAWEKHIDKDGVEREYACTDVLLCTGLYGEEAAKIIDKSQSMELYEKTLEYHYEVINGQQYLVFDNACFLGLQVLGDNVEPCFEGAAFYSKSLKDLTNTITKLVEDFQKMTYELNEGGQSMPKLNFKLSDSAKHEALWNLLNTNYTEEGGWQVDYSIIDVYDDYALVMQYGCGAKRVKYIKDNETDSVTIESIEDCYIMDVTASEKETLDTLRRLNGETYECVSDILENADANAEAIKEYSEKIEEYDTKFVELEAEKATLIQEKENLSSEFEALKEKQDSNEKEIEDLRAYKLDIELKEKEAVLEKYNAQLSEEVLSEYKDNIESYTVVDLEKELAYAFVQSNIDVFSRTSQTEPVVPKETQKQGIEAILDRYKK